MKIQIPNSSAGLHSDLIPNSNSWTDDPILANSYFATLPADVRADLVAAVSALDDDALGFATFGPQSNHYKWAA